MAGRKQHYIPQFILRRFAENKNKKSYVNVYRKDKIFSPPTDGVAAQKDFYSAPEPDGSLTLDDVITDYEVKELEPKYKKIALANVGEDIDSELVADVLAHLSVRQALLRNTFSSISKQLMEGISCKFHDELWLEKRFCLNKKSPNSEILKIIDEVYDEQKNNLPFHLRKISEFRQLVFNMMKLNSVNSLIDIDILKCIEQIFFQLADKHVKDAHNKVMHLGMAPEIRVQALKKLKWALVQKPLEHEGFILPDCVVISMDKGKIRPLAYADIKNLGSVIFPISSDRILLGSYDGLDQVPFRRINKLLAECSLDFFVSRQRHDSFEKLRPIIGKQLNLFIDSIVKDAIISIK